MLPAILSCLVVITSILTSNIESRQYHQYDRKIFDPFPDPEEDLSLWIDEQQVKIFSGRF